MYCSEWWDMALQSWSNLIDSSQIGEVILQASLLVPSFIWLDADCKAKLISCKLMQRRANAVEQRPLEFKWKKPCLGRMTSCFGSKAISRTTDIWLGATWMVVAELMQLGQLSRVTNRYEKMKTHKDWQVNKHTGTTIWMSSCPRLTYIWLDSSECVVSTPYK